LPPVACGTGMLMLDVVLTVLFNTIVTDCVRMTRL
jgi:hypothetical protein